MPDFTQYPEEATKFFASLSKNLNREWFEAHKQDYYDYVHAPSQDFVMALGPRIAEILPGIEFDPKKSLMRIYRDIRFSADKTPYKTYQGFVIWEGSRSKPKDNPGFRIGIDAEGMQIFGGMYLFDKTMLKGYRGAVADDDLGSELRAILNDFKAPYAVEGERGKRVPNGFEKDHPRADLLLYKGLYVRVPQISPSIVHSKALLDEVMMHIENLAPLHRWLVKVDASSQ